MKVLILTPINDLPGVDDETAEVTEVTISYMNEADMILAGLLDDDTVLELTEYVQIIIYHHTCIDRIAKVLEGLIREQGFDGLIELRSFRAFAR